MMDIREINKLKQFKEMLVEDNNFKSEIKHIDNKTVQNINSDRMSETNYNNSLNNIKKEFIRPEVKRKEIWYVDFGKRQGSLQSGIRPAIIDSNDISNRFSNIINVYPLTSQMTKANIPVHVKINGYGLKEESIILIEQGTAIDIRFQLLEYIGTVDELVMKRVDRAKKIQLGDLKPKTTFDRLDTEKQQFVINKLNAIKECDTVLNFLRKRNGSKTDIDIAEDEKFEAENAVMAFCYNNSINPEEFYSTEKGINEAIKDKLIAL